jgi:hypothetical protein
MSEDNDLWQTCELQITGVGYLVNVVGLKSKAGRPLLTCDILAFTDGGSRRIEATVESVKAEAVIRQCKDDVNAGNLVMVAFCLSDIWGEVVSYSTDPESGTVKARLKSRLMAVSLFSRHRDWTADDCAGSSWEQETMSSHHVAV